MSRRFGLLVVGGGPAGLAAARAYRQAGGTGDVAIVADEHRAPYSRPPLTKELLRGETGEDDLPIETDVWLAEHKIAVVSGRAVSLDVAQRTVELSGGRELAYRSCVLATGAEPGRIPVPGADDAGVRVVRTVDNVRELIRRLGKHGSAVVIGAGFIGCETAASLRMRGHPVTLISDELAPNQGRLGPDTGTAIAGWLDELGVDRRPEATVEAINRNGESLEVIAGDVAAHGDVVVMATGVQPRGELAAAAGLELADGAIPVDAAMRTALDRLLAAGDVCRAENRAAGRPLRVEHWGDALGQGELAGRTAAGAPGAWDGVPGFWSTIGRRTLKHAAWGDGHDRIHFERHDNGGFTAWYGREDVLVGVLTHEADEDYERGGALVREGAPWTF